MIIGINGKIGHGKDALASMLVKLDSQLKIRKFAHPIKKLCAQLIGCSIKDLECQDFKNTTLSKVWDYCTLSDNVKYSYHSTEVACAIKRGEYVSTHQMTVRDLLQRIGTDACRDMVHPDIWVNSMFSSYNLLVDNWIISDVRFPNEAQHIRYMGGILIKIIRTTTCTSYHSSECALDEFTNWDYVIDNNGSLTDLQHKVTMIYNKITNPPT